MSHAEEAQAAFDADLLIAFEARVAAAFNAGLIRAPVHLAGGNEKQLIKVFKEVREKDWVFTTWRSHYHCLLKGVPPERLFKDIVAGRSITLCYPEHRIVSSAIVGGILPIALGVALAAKRKGTDEVVWAFIGDMAAAGGMMHEVAQYAEGHDLPLRIVIESNDISVSTPTLETWGQLTTCDSMIVDGYSYILPWPHAGAGKRINF